MIGGGFVSVFHLSFRLSPPRCSRVSSLLLVKELNSVGLVTALFEYPHFAEHNGITRHYHYWHASGRLIWSLSFLITFYSNQSKNVMHCYLDYPVFESIQQTVAGIQFVVNRPFLRLLNPLSAAWIVSLSITGKCALAPPLSCLPIWMYCMSCLTKLGLA